jgi:hypothetical protein
MFTDTPLSGAGDPAMAMVDITSDAAIIPDTLFIPAPPWLKVESYKQLFAF